MSQTIDFLKGHGTGNDFIILPDESAELDLTVGLTAALCDRRFGIGADGVLRVARAGALVHIGVLDFLPADVERDDWFMDYRNADGSIAEMCGNGVRVFAHYVASRGLADGDRIRVGTRAGLRPVTITDVTEASATVAVDMGTVGVLGAASARLGEQMVAGVGIDVGNPHLACVIPDLDATGLREVALGGPETVGAPADMFPAGVNVEILTPLADGGVDMRVLERGVGETLSCGTGTVAAATAALADAGRTSGDVEVRVPGGRVTVTLTDDGAATLTGPSAIHTAGTIDVGALLMGRPVR